MLERKYFLVAVLIFASCFSNQAYGITLKRTLSKSQKVSVFSNNCTLVVKSLKTSKIKISCAGKKNRKGNKVSPRSTARNIYLRGSQEVSLSKGSCSLAIVALSDKKIEVQCLADSQTATSTPSATSTTTPTPSAISSEATPSATPTATNTPDVTPDVEALYAGNKIISFNKALPAYPKAPVNLSGVEPGDIISSIDRRPMNNLLYGIGYNPTSGTVRLYCINSLNGVATAVGPLGSFVDGSGNPTRIGVDAATKLEIDFDPTSDRLRVVTSNGQNFRINPNNGRLIDGDLGGAGVAGVNMDGHINGANTFVEAAAYTDNSFNASNTTLYTIESTTKSLYIQSPVDTGSLTTSSIFASDIDSIDGFDLSEQAKVPSSNVPANTGIAYSFMKVASDTTQKFCSFELTASDPLSCIQIGSYTDGFLGLSLIKRSEVDTFHVGIIGLSFDGATLLKFKRTSIGTVISTSVTGVVAGETLVALDSRPTTGEFMALGINEAADNGTLYRLDPHTGEVEVIGIAGSVALVDQFSSSIDLPSNSFNFALNFDPVTDTIRVIAGNGLNFRIDPNTGIPTQPGPDSYITGAAITGASYTDSYAGASNATLYTIDAVAEKLYIQNPPNSGFQSFDKDLFNIASWEYDLDPVMGFEVLSNVRSPAMNKPVIAEPHKSVAFASITDAGITKLFAIQLRIGRIGVSGVIGDGNTRVRSIALTHSDE